MLLLCNASSVQCKVSTRRVEFVKQCLLWKQIPCEGSIAAYEGRNSIAQDPFHTLNTLEDMWLLSSMGSFLFLHPQNYESILFPR